jgi:hypothetical protein
LIFISRVLEVQDGRKDAVKPKVFFADGFVSTEAIFKVVEELFGLIPDFTAVLHSSFD